MNFKLRYPWIETGRKCKVYIESVYIEGENNIKEYDAEIVEIGWRRK